MVRAASNDERWLPVTRPHRPLRTRRAPESPHPRRPPVPHGRAIGFGFAGTMRRTSVSEAVFVRVVKPSYVRVRTALASVLFDKRYGIDTEGSISEAELGLPSPDSRSYAPAYVLTLPRILPRREVGPDDVLVD